MRMECILEKERKEKPTTNIHTNKKLAKIFVTMFQPILNNAPNVSREYVKHVQLTV